MDEAVDWGLVARRCAHEDLMAMAEDALAWCARSAPEARRDAKRVMNEFYGHYDRISMDAVSPGPRRPRASLAFKERRDPGVGPGAAAHRRPVVAGVGRGHRVTPPTGGAGPPPTAGAPGASG